MQLYTVVGDSAFGEVANALNAVVCVVIVPVRDKNAHVIYTTNPIVLSELRGAKAREVTDENILFSKAEALFLIGWRIGSIKDLISKSFDKANEM